MRIATSNANSPSRSNKRNGQEQAKRPNKPQNLNSRGTTRHTDQARAAQQNYGRHRPPQNRSGTIPSGQRTFIPINRCHQHQPYS
ncbi:hypothetical protein PTTG_12278 [Puccinia triticina 1-1 BBBD Race 1]|uniref:Uncharacterized protein n=1 Tax=Puccinia triticina (isolate 1-1 / race 1 (BBBD)) TaxID=630390 RepID=A0A180GAA7_PUCT1|nr:hypothetical protein PTTG_12278 [Puccinia triticina 1-1 BBBD Race 1]